MRPVDAVSVPVIDLAPARAAAADRLRVAAAIDAACREIGFFAIDGHGVPARVVDELRAVAHAFFAMPREDKLAARQRRAGAARSEGVLPRRTRRCRLRRVLYERRGPPALHAERLAGGAA